MYEKMKLLKCNFTTIEQGERLHRVDLPIESADCYHDEVDDGEWDIAVFTQPIDKREFFKREDVKPCWSLGRLIEIVNMCYRDKYDQGFGYYFWGEEDLVEYLVKRIEWECDRGNGYWGELDVMDWRNLYEDGIESPFKDLKVVVIE